MAIEKGKKVDKKESENDLTTTTQFDNMVEVNLRGGYLPNILVKLGEFVDNAEARKFIRRTGVKVNGIQVNNIDEKFIKGQTYSISIKDMEYLVIIF